jgi:CheY-like chemotaxis protein
VESSPGAGSTFHFTVTLWRGERQPAGSAPAPDAAKPALPAPVGRPLHLLLVEDNRVNQQVVAGFLRRHGHTFALAENGLEALEALGRQPFDAVLMDVQMPGMDGWEATRQIRAREAGGPRHVPIIAMTAHVLKGDRERCLNAGMDAYLPKPVDLQALGRLLGTLVATADAVGRNGDNHHAPAASPEPAETDSEPDFDRKEALERVGGDEQLLGELLHLFQTDAPKWLADLRSAIDRGDAAQLRRAAHTIKGGASNLGARQTWTAAARLEELARTGSWDGVEAARAELEGALARLDAETAAFAPRS